MSTGRPPIFVRLSDDTDSVDVNSLPAADAQQYNQLRAQVKATEVRQSNTGRGLFAKQFIPAGSPIIEYVGDRISTAEMNRRWSRYQALGFTEDYFQSIDRSTHLDATYWGNNAHRVNHGCAPNVEAQVVRLQVSGLKVVWLYAISNIEEGQELRSDYGFHKSDPYNLVICECGHATCRNYI